MDKNIEQFRNELEESAKGICQDLEKENRSLKDILAKKQESLDAIKHDKSCLQARCFVFTKGLLCYGCEHSRNCERKEQSEHYQKMVKEEHKILNLSPKQLKSYIKNFKRH